MTQSQFGAGGLLVAISLAASGVAYGESELSPGDRIRVVALVGKGRITGTLVAVDEELINAGVRIRF
jgi:hypothetical protein